MDLNPGVSNAGQQISAEMQRNAGGSPISGSSGNKMVVDSSDVATLHSRLQAVIADIGKLDKAVESLVGNLSKASDHMGNLVSGGGQAGSSGGGSSGLTTAGFSSPGTSPSPAGGTTTPAAVGYLNKAATALTFGAAGGFISSAAGTMNTAMSTYRANGMAQNLQSAQSLATFGMNTGQGMTAYASQQYNKINAFSQADRAGAISTLQGNSFLYRAPGSISAGRITAFTNAAQSLNPLMGAAGAAQFANTLASGGAMQTMMRYGGVGNGLIGKNGQINSAGTTMADLFKTVMQGRTGTGAQMKQAAKDSGLWASVAQNFGSGTQMNLTTAEINEIRQYAAAGGNLKQAEKQMTGTGATHALKAASQISGAKQSAYQDSVPWQNTENDAKAAMAGWTKNLLDSQQGLGLFATAVAGIVPHIMSLGGALSKVGDVYMAAKGAKGILGVGKSLVSRVSGGGSADAATTAGGDAAVTTTAAEVGGDAAAAGGTGAAAAVGTVALPVAAIAGLTWLSMHVGNQNRDTTGIGYHGPSAKQLGKMDHVPKVNYSQISKLTQDLSTPAMQADLKAIVAQQQAEGKGDPPTGSTSTMGMTGAMKQRVSAMMAANPNLKISSGHRTSSQQAYLYAAKGGQGVARPGQSAHQSGKAADMGPPSQFGWIAKNASKFGLSRPAPRSEPWHVQVMGDPAATVTGAQVVSGAEAQEGSNYVWGGSTPGSFDCSGLVQYVYKQLGITLPRTSQAQANAGTAVQGIGSAQPGDLIFYNEPGEGPNSHVAIYIGGGKQVEAAHTGTVVAINPIDTPHLSCIRRIVGGGAGSAAAAGAQSTVGATSNDAASHAIAAAAPTSMSNSFLAGVASLGGMSGGGGGGILAGALPGGGSVGAAAGSGTATTGTATTGTTPPGTAGSVVSAVKAVTSNRNVQLAMLTGSSLESNQNPKAVGAGSYGAWQIQMLSGRNVTQAQAEDPNFAAKFMVGQYTSAMNAVPSSLWTTNGAQAAEQVAYAAERPAETYFASQGAARVASAYATAVSEVGPPIAMGDPVGTMSGMGGAGSVSGGGGMGGGNTYHLHMPVQVANATQQDAQRLVSMVLAELKTQAGIDAMSGG